MRFAAPLALFALLASASPALAAKRLYSYDSANPVTRKMTEAGLTFVFEKSLMNARVLKLVETHDIGSADLKPASQDQLGKGGLSALIGDAPERDLYEITDDEDGKPLKRALCRAGNAKVYLAFGRLKVGRDLRIHAVTFDPATHQGRLCVTLDYNFHGEWALPTPLLPQPDRTDRFNDAPNNRRY